MCSVDDDSTNDIKSHNLPIDLELCKNLARPNREHHNPDWEPSFFPQWYAVEIEDLTLDDRRLDAVDLREFGLLVSRARAQLRSFAVEYDHAIADNVGIPIGNVSALAVRVDHGYFSEM